MRPWAKAGAASIGAPKEICQIYSPELRSKAYKVPFRVPK